MNQFSPQRAEARASFARSIRMQGDCMIWTGPMSSGNAPQWRSPLESREINARRWLWIDEGFALTEGRRLRNTCGNPHCVLPAHQRITHGKKRRRA